MSLLEKNSFCKEIERKILNPDHLERVSMTFKRTGKVLVTINGCFDMLHPGHLDMLYKAARFGGR